MKQNVIFIILLSFLYACGTNKIDQQPETAKRSGRALLDSMHSGFNKVELTKQFLTNNNDTTTIVAFGHVYHLLNHEEAFDLMINTINNQNPDYVWVLGDIVFNNSEEEWKHINEKYKKLKGKRFHAPGNHDINYHYERWIGSIENQWEAESRYLKNVGYRYITLEDDVANYMMVNLNDSLDRVKKYLDKMTPELNEEKLSILFTHQDTWFDFMEDPEDPQTWPRKNFERDSLLKELRDFDYLIHGDWNEKFYEGEFKGYNVVSLGNLNQGDPLNINVIKVTKSDIKIESIEVDIPENSSWYDSKK